MGYELLLTEAGTCILQSDDADDPEMLWSSDGDDDFAEEFGDVVSSGELNDVASWLVEEGYLPPRVGISIVDESLEPGEDSGWFKQLPDKSDEENES